MSWRDCIVCLCLGAVLAVSGVSELCAQSNSLPAFRRVFIPQEAIAAQIGGLLPMKREEFERRIGPAAGLRSLSVAPPGFHIEEAHYRARLGDRHLSAGSARLSISAWERDAPALVKLTPCNLAITGAQWSGQDEPAIVGVDVNGQLQCEANRSGVLELHWSLAAASSTAAWTEFRFELPAATRRSLELLCEDNRELSLVGGVCLERPTSAAGHGLRKWRFELTGNESIVLRSHLPTATPSNSPRLLVRESSTYSLWPSSLDLEATLDCDSPVRTPSELQLHLEAPLMPVAVQVDDRQAAFEIREAAEPGGGQVLVIPVARSSAPRLSVHVAATAVWTLPGAKMLPRVRLVESLLQDARREITVPEWMQIVARPTGSCVQTQASAATGGRATERFAFQIFAGDGGVEIEPAQPNYPLEERSGMQITADGNQIVGVLMAELSGQGRETFNVEAEVPRQWIVDSVEAVPATMLADRAISARGAGPQRLQLKLAQPIEQGRSLRLIVRGHFRRPAGGELRGPAAFQLARFPAVGVSRRLITMRVNDPGIELTVAGDESLVRHSADDLSATDRELFESPPVGLVFESASGVDELTAALKPSRASYRAEVSLLADVGKGASEQTAVLRCLPEGATVGAVMVRMTPPPRSPVRWQLVGDETRELAAIVEGDASRDEAVTYRLSLPRSFNAPIEIRGQWTVAAPGPLSLLSLSEASRQSSIVEIRSSTANVDIESQGLTALPLPKEDGTDPACRGRFSYEAGQPARCSIERSRDFELAPAAWIESLHVTSHIAVAGEVQNEAELIIRNAATDRLLVQFPEEIKECQWNKNEQGEVLLPVNAGTFSVPLEPGADSQRIVLRYLSPAIEQSYWPLHPYRPALPLLPAPVLGRTWSASLSPGLAPVALDERWRRAGFSPLAAPQAANHELPFASAKGWRTLAKYFQGLALLPKSGWLQLPEGARSNSAAFGNWQIFSRPLHNSESVSITVFRVPVLLAWSLAAVTALFPLGARLARSPAWLYTSAALLLAAAVALEPPWSWLCLGGLAGLLLGVVLRRVSRQQLPSTRQVPYAWAAAESAAVLFVPFAVVAWSCPVQAAPPTEAPAAARVVFPVDGELQPAGEYVYLEPAFYEAIYRLSDIGRSTDSAWLIESAHYECSNIAPLSADSPAIINLRLDMRLHTLRDHTEVRLPFRRQQLLVQPNSTRLDDAPAPLTWDEAGESLSLRVPTAGEHQLTLALAGAARQVGDVMVLDAAIPKAAITSVRIPQHAAIQGLQIHGVDYASAVNDPADWLVVGPRDRLQIRWPVQGSAPLAQTVEAEQLTWWKIRPASVVLEMQVRLRSPGLPIRALRLKVDPRLRPLASLNTGDVGRVMVEDERTGRLLIELVQPAEEARLRLGWLWPDSPTLGTLVLPEIELDGATVSRPWTAISLDSGLQIEQLGGASDRVEPAEFARVWGGDAGLLPLVAIQHSFGSTGADRLHFTIRPAAHVAQVQANVDCTFSRSAVTTSASFRLSDVASTCFEHSVKIPAAWKVSKVRLLQGDRQADIRWRQEGSGKLWLTLLEQPASEATLIVDASLTSRSASGHVELPVWTLENAQITQRRLRVFRHADAKLTLESHAGWLLEVSPPISETEIQTARLCLSLQAENPVAPSAPVIRREINRPHVTGAQVTKITEADGDWQAETTWNLEIADGAVDFLRFHVPADWPEPLSLEPACRYTSEPTASEGRRLITVFPPSALRERVELRLRGPLSVSTGALEAPVIHLLDVGTVQQYLLLDGGSAGQPIEWETRGLVAANKREIIGLVDQPDRFNVYRVVRDRYRAVARHHTATGRRAQIAMARFETEPAPLGRAVTTAHFLIVPEGAAELTFDLPHQSRLLQVRADDLPLVATRTGIRRWTVPARSNVLPFEFSIVYDSAWAPDTDAVIPSPELLDFEPAPAIWTVHEPDADSGALQIAESAGIRECSRHEARLARLEGLAKALDAVQSARVAALPAKVLVAAFYHWNDELQSELASPAPGVADNTEGVDHIARQNAVQSMAAGVYQRMIQAGLLAEDSPIATGATPRSPAPQRNGDRYFMVPDLAAGLPIAIARSEVPPLPWRSLLGAAVVLGAVMGPPLARKLRLEESWIAGPPVLWVLLGVLWWIFAPFGLLGWISVAAGVWALLGRYSRVAQA